MIAYVHLWYRSKFISAYFGAVLYVIIWYLTIITLKENQAIIWKDMQAMKSNCMHCLQQGDLTTSSLPRQMKTVQKKNEVWEALWYLPEAKGKLR